MSETTSAYGTATAFAVSREVETRAEGTGEGLLAPREPADWSEGCINRIQRLCELQPNWDSYGANSVDAASIDIAAQLVRVFAGVTGIDCPRVAASPAGNVALSWEWQDHSRELDLEILANGMLRFAYLDEKSPSEDREDETNDARMIAHLLTKW